MTQATTPEKKKGFLASFPATYWVTIFLEFLERGAYYGLNAVLAVYLNEKLGFSPESVGFLQGFVYALTYIVPIAGGALAERYGATPMLAIAIAGLIVNVIAFTVLHGGDRDNLNLNAAMLHVLGDLLFQ